MIKISSQSNLSMAEKPQYMCSKTEYAIQTDAEDGSTLMVIDESSHTVDGYYVAFNGYWNEL